MPIQTSDCLPEARRGFAGFDWGFRQPQEVPKPQVSIAEIESLFDRPVVILPHKENFQGERRFRAIGTTSKKRNAFVVFTQRNSGNGVLIRPISARYMHKREVESYEIKLSRRSRTDKEAEDFVAFADLTDYDLSGGEVVRFELKRRKINPVNLRLPAQRS